MYTDWLHVHERFESPESMKTKLNESFTDYLPHRLDNPPNVPAITGRPVTKRKEKDKDNDFADTLTGAATAITKLLVGNQPATPNKTVTNKPTGISPVSKANLSGQYLQHLSGLQQLRESSVLTEEEFHEPKRLCCPT